jgi:GT2 family glycosyltransferase
MNNKVSILLPSYKREHLLKWGLFSLAKQKISYDYEIIVLNDGIHDGTEALVNSYKDKLNIRYIFTGHRNVEGKGEFWRVPGMCLNVGVKQSDGDILIFCCPEIFHINNTIDILTKGTIENPNSMVIPLGKDDLNPGTFLKHVNDTNGNIDINQFNPHPKVATIYPFLMGMTRKVFTDIGGYDEKMGGYTMRGNTKVYNSCYDDSDLTYRLKRNGVTYVEKLDAKMIHLYHPRGNAKGPLFMIGHRINKNIFNQHNRNGVIVVNQGVEWGQNK